VWWNCWALQLELFRGFMYPIRDLLSRVGGMMFFGFLLYRRARVVPSDFWLVVWWLEVVYFILLILTYVLRSQVRERAVGFSERWLPFLIPMFLMSLGTEPIVHADLRMWAISLLMVGDAIQLTGVWTLRRNFSVMVEARSVVSQGIYRYVRHPLYLGGFFSGAGVWLLRMSVWTTVLFVLFVVGEVYRAVLEERKLEGSFPEYTSYKQCVPMFIPWHGGFQRHRQASPKV